MCRKLHSFKGCCLSHRKKILGINCEGKKEVLTIEVGDNESSKYWLSVLNGLKNRGVRDILIICADGLTGIREAIQAAFPKTEYQRCIVHQVRNTLKYVADKGCKNGYALWPIRTAVSGKQMTPAGATEIMEIIGKEETIARVKTGIELLSK